MVEANNFELNKNVKTKLILDYTDDIETSIHITFGVPTFGRDSTLKETLDSIVALKGLEKINYEIIVVDNSADFSDNNKTKRLLNSNKYANLKYYINEINIGMEGNFNRIFLLAKGKFVSLVHDDDLLHDTYLECVSRMLDSIDDSDRFGFLKVKYQIFNSADNLPELKDTRLILDKCSLLKSMLAGIGPTWTPSCGMLFDREAVINCGGFCPDLFPSSDHAIGIVMLNKGYRGYETIDPLAFYRIGINESMKLATIKGFIEKDTFIRLYMYSLKWYGNIFSQLFERTLYCERIDFWISYAKRRFDMDISQEQLDFQGQYGNHKIGCFLLRVLRKINRIIGKTIRSRNT